MDHSNHIRLREDELTQDIIDGATVYGPDDSKVATVDHVHGFGVDVQIIVDVGGLFGLGAKPVALSLGDLDFMRDEDGEVHAKTRLTEDQLKELPEHKE
jgi:hypothetical protein